MSPPTPLSLRHDERGIALAIAIFALVIIATLVAGVFFMARLEQRSGSNALWSTQAQEAADAGLNAVVANWPSAINGAPLGVPQALATTVLGGNIRYTPAVTKMSDQIFLVQSRGERTDAAGGVLSGVTVGRIVRMVVPNIQADAALTSKGGASVGGNSIVDGRNSVPEGWTTCPSPLPPDKAGVRTDASSVKGTDGKHIFGSPPKDLNDTEVTNQMFDDLFNAFIPLANKLLTNAIVGSSENMNGMGPTLSGGTCNTGDAFNWGEPYRNPPQSGAVPACYGYMPVLYRPGNLKVQTGRGQGILLVDGDFEVRGNFVFNGIVIARGEVKGNGTGNKITGAVFAQNAEIGDLTSFIGDPQVRYSSCSISQVLLGTARARPLAERSWVQLY
jgi:hypothetical protein